MALILTSLVLLPLLLSFSVYLIGRWKKERSFWISVFLSAFFFVFTLMLFFDYLMLIKDRPGLLMSRADSRLYSYQETVRWIPLLNVEFSFGLDGLSLALCMLTTFIMMVVVLASRLSIARKDWPAFYMLAFITESGLLGTFLAADMIVFLVFWELVLIPMFFIILFHGHGNHVTSAYVFFIYTHLGGLFLVIGVLGAWLQAQALTGGRASFSFETWAFDVPWYSNSGFMVVLVSFMLLAFLIKLPVFPFHAWLPRAHVDAPTPGSMILAGLLLKMGGYGLIRFGYWFFPDIIVNTWILPVLGLLSVISIVLIAGVAFRQDDLKRLVAFSSIVHMSMAVLGFLASLATSSPEALTGSVLMLVAHGILSPGMFYVVGELQRLHGTRSISWLMQHVNLSRDHVIETVLMFVMFLGSMGFPTLAEFVPEFTMLVGILRWDAMLAFMFVLGAMLMMATFTWALVRLLFPQANFIRIFMSATMTSSQQDQPIFHDNNMFDGGKDDIVFLRLLLAVTFIVTAFYLGIFPHAIIGVLNP